MELTKMCVAGLGGCSPLDQHKPVRSKGTQYCGCLRLINAILFHGLFDVTLFDFRGFGQSWAEYNFKKIVVRYGYESSIFAMKSAEARKNGQKPEIRIILLVT
jgi:pimeloyl-ACP methyl ester carboxylesterase